MKELIVKNGWFSDSDLRLDATYYLSDGPLTKLKMKVSPFKVSSLSKETSEIFKGNIFKRMYVSDAKNGYHFMTASDMMKSNIESGKFVSKKYTNTANLFLKEGWILVSRSGTLGNVVYTNGDFDGVLGTDDLIRVVPNNKNIKSGFMYAYLATKYGYGLLTQSGYGGVVQHIEPHHIENLPIPLFPQPKQQKIHNLIIEASNFRIEANKLLNMSVSSLQSRLPKISHEKVYISTLQIRKDNQCRLEATFLADKTKTFYKEIKKQGIEVRTITELSSDVFTPNIFKRIRVTKPENGVPYLSGSDLIDQMPSFNSFLSKKMDSIDSYLLKEGWLTFQDSGTIGYLNLINSYLDGVSATNNLVRVVPNTKSNHNYYIFCFFKTRQGLALLKSLEYGSVQKHIDHHQIGRFQIPIYKDLFKGISNNIQKMLTLQGDACKLEKKAITLIEKEIESWQK